MDDLLETLSNLVRLLQFGLTYSLTTNCALAFVEARDEAQRCRAGARDDMRQRRLGTDRVLLHFQVRLRALAIPSAVDE